MTELERQLMTAFRTLSAQYENSGGTPNRSKPCSGVSPNRPRRARPSGGESSGCPSK